MRPRPRDNGTVLYATSISTAIRVLVFVLVGVIALVALLVLGAFLVASEAGPIALALTVLVVVAVAVGLCLLVRSGFVVTTEGLTVVNPFGTHHVAWPEVALVEVREGLLLRGATVVRRRDGRRTTALVTAATYAMHRGESYGDHGPSLLSPARPTRAAQWAHTQFLRGDFARQRV